MADPSYLLQGQYLGQGNQVDPPPSGTRLLSPSGFYEMFCLEGGVGEACVTVHSTGNNDANYTQLWASPNADWYKGGACCTQLMEQGVLCAFLGSGPSDGPGSSNYNEIFSSPPRPLANGLYYLIMQDDGNLCIYTGNTIGEGDLIWQSGVTDPATQISFGYLNYDFSNGTIQELDPYELYSDTLSNDTDSDTQVPVKGAESAPETLVWAQTPIVNPGTIQISPIIATPPRLVNGKFILLNDQPQADLNVEEESSKEWNWYEMVTVPAGSEVKVSVTVKMAKIIVPFTWMADITYKSGQIFHVPYSGVFSGLTSHDLSITVTPVDPNQ